MMKYLDNIFNKLMEIINLSSRKQVIFILLVLTVLSFYIIYKFNNDKEDDCEALKNQNIFLVTVIEEKRRHIDSLNELRYTEQVAYLTKELQRSDSLLKVSNSIKTSIKPIINNLNKKIDKLNENAN